MKNNLLKKIKVKPQKRFNAKGGDVLKILKKSDKSFKGFGEVYFSLIKYKSIKAWKYHKNMTMNLVVPQGRVKFVFYNHLNKKFLSKIIGEKKYSRITVPPKIWFGFQGLSKSKNLILNFSNIEHKDKEVVKCSIKSINYKW